MTNVIGKLAESQETASKNLAATIDKLVGTAFAGTANCSTNNTDDAIRKMCQ